MTKWVADGRQVLWTTPLQVEIVGLESEVLPEGVLGELRFRANPAVGAVEFVAGVREETDWELMKAFITWVDEACSNLAANPDPQALGWQLCPPETGWQWWMHASVR